MTPPNDPAFPVVCQDFSGHRVCGAGLTKREWFAGMALQGVIASFSNNFNVADPQDTAKTVLKFADALLAELSRGNDET